MARKLDKVRLTSRLLQRAADLASQSNEIQGKLTAAFRHRYGTTYSDADADSLIDVLDYHGGSIDLEECDKIMIEAGYPPLKRGKNNAHEPE